MKLTLRNFIQNSQFFLNSIKSNPAYSLFYCDNSPIYGLENFGDMLSHYIVEKITNKKMTKTNSKNPHKFIAVGSLINNYTIQSGGVFWGTGVGDNISDITSTRHKYPVSFRAVRGPITRNHLLSAGYKCPQIYGDPALLLPRFYQTKLEKT